MPDIDLDTLTAMQYEELSELVHDAASAIATAAINEGEQVTFLLSQGWTLTDIVDAIASHTSHELRSPSASASSSATPGAALDMDLSWEDLDALAQGDPLALRDRAWAEILRLRHLAYDRRCSGPTTG